MAREIGSAPEVPLPPALLEVGPDRSGTLRPALNPARVDLVSMQLLLECAARGSISAAAPYCHLSVMGASERLRRLEDALGKPLFLRHRGGLEPTQAGLAALRVARVMLQALRQLVEAVDAAPAFPASRPQNVGRRGRSTVAKKHGAVCDEARVAQ
jgi:molybdenum-dependent DNA-binding transcriptional regulator ModE